MIRILTPQNSHPPGCASLRLKRLTRRCCVTTNHFHLLLEVPPPPSEGEFGLTEEELASARIIAEGKWEGFSELSKAQQKKEIAFGRSEVTAIFNRYTRWFNKRHGVRGTLWEDRFHSVIVQSGLASRTMAAYVDLNPVRAGICEDPADYR